MTHVHVQQRRLRRLIVSLLDVEQLELKQQRLAGPQVVGIQLDRVVGHLPQGESAGAVGMAALGNGVVMLGASGHTPRQAR